MDTEVKVGQVWRDKDKRRQRLVEVLSVTDNEVHALIVGTEDETSLKIDRFVKRWELISEKKETLNEAKDERIQEKIHSTREAWLSAAVETISEEIFSPKFTVPPVRVSVGWPGGRGPKQNTIGQCWPGDAASDSVGQIFISPVLAEPVKVLETLVHEMVHAINHANGETGHRGPFKSIAVAVGLEGKMTSTHAGLKLAEKLEEIGTELGKYPHAAINLADKPKVQKTYMLKFVSPEEPDFFVRMTASKLEEYGAPRDPWGNEMEQEL